MYWQVFEFNWLSCLGFRIVYYYISTYVCVSPFLKVRHSCSSHMFVTHVRHTCSSHKFITHFSVAKATLHSQMSVRLFIHHKTPQQLEIIILHHSWLILLSFRDFWAFQLVSKGTEQNQVKSCDEHKICIGHLTNWAIDQVIFCCNDNFNLL